MKMASLGKYFLCYHVSLHSILGRINDKKLHMVPVLPCIFIL